MDKKNWKDTYKLVSKVEINKPIQEVFDAVTTSSIWVHLYPETVAVGGVTDRPFKKGDLILEKFLYGGWLYSMFQYEVDEYAPPKRITFHGKLIMGNDLLDRVIGKLAPNAGGTFEYELEEKGKDVTLWTRNLYFYHTGGLISKICFKILLATVLRSQKKGAALFVNYVKQALESECL